MRQSRCAPRQNGQEQIYQHKYGKWPWWKNKEASVVALAKTSTKRNRGVVSWLWKPQVSNAGSGFRFWRDCGHSPRHKMFLALYQQKLRKVQSKLLFITFVKQIRYLDLLAHQYLSAMFFLCHSFTTTACLVLSTKQIFQKYASSK